MNLAVDIDGVICDWQLHLQKLVSERLDVQQPYLETWDQIKEVRDKKTGRTIASFAFGEWKDELHRDAPVLGNAVEVMHQLIAAKVDIFYVTARTPDQETDKWLKRHGFPGVLHFMWDKTAAPCPAIVDDHVDNLVSYEKKYRIPICFDQPWNRHRAFKYRISSIDELPGTLKAAGLIP